MGNRLTILLTLLLWGASALTAWAQPPLMFPPETPPEGQPPGFAGPGYPPPQSGPPMGYYPNVMPNYPPVPWGAPIPGAADPRKDMEKKYKSSANPLEIKAEGPGAFNIEEPCIKDQGCYANIGGMFMMRSRLQSQGVVFLEPASPNPGISTFPTTPQPVVLNYRDVPMNFNFGPRGAIGYHYDTSSVELSGFYLPGQNSFSVVSNKDNLYLPFAQYPPPPVGITGGGNNANVWLRVDQARVLDNTTLANLEGNYRVVVAPGAELLFGLRYLRCAETLGILSDQDGLSTTPPDPRFMVTYQVQTLTNIIGPQVGFELENNIFPWLTVGVNAKLLGGVNFYSVDVQVYRADGFVALNNRRTNATLSGAVETGAYFDFLPLERVRFRAGYELLWIYNVPDAVSEVSYNINADPFGSHHDHGNILFAGPFFEFSFAF